MSLGQDSHNLFIGRARELGQLRTGLEAAISGHGQLVLLAGDPGIGKTSLAEEFTRGAAEGGALVLWGRCWEGDGAPALWPWIQILRSVVERWPAEALTAELGTGAAVIAQVVPELYHKLPGLSALPSIDTEDARFRFFDCLTTFFTNVGQRQPVVLIFDDLHWADPSSLGLLRFLSSALLTMRLLIIGTYRDNEVTRAHPLATTVGELARHGYTLPLHGLSVAELTQFIHLTNEVVPAAHVISALYEQTQGNPFFVKEMLQLATAPGHQLGPARAPLTGSSIPLGIQETIRRRVTRLSPASIDLLRLASVIGREFGLDVLQQAPSAGAAFASSPLLPLLNEAWEARLIETVPETIGRYRFVHALVRETLYEDLSLAERVQCHREIGETIERLHAAHLDPYLAVLADHFEKAVPGGEAEKALRYRLKAGEAAMALFAYEEAVAHYARAQQLVTLVPSDGLQHWRLLLHLGDAQQRVGATNEARETYLQAAALARRGGAHTGNTEAARALARAALGVGGQGDLATRSDRVMAELLDEALQLITTEDATLRVRLLSRLAIALYFLHAPERREALSQEAVALARRLGDPATLAEALAARYYALWGPDHVEERLAIARETLRLGEVTESKDMMRAGYIFRALTLLEVGDIVALDENLQLYTELITELRQPYYLWRGSSLRTMRALLVGQFAEGEQRAQETLAHGQRAQTPNASLVFTISLFALRREQGRLQELEEPFKQFVERYPAIRTFRTGLAFLYSELGRQADARGEFEQVAARGFTAIPRDGNWLNAYQALAQTCAFLGDVRRAAELYDALLPCAGQNVVIGFADGCEGPVSRYLGLLAATMSQWDNAERHFTDAIAMNTRMGARPFLAHTQCEYASMLLQRNQLGDHNRADALLETAQETAHALGMTRLQEKIAGHRERMMQDTSTPRVLVPAFASVNSFRFESKRWTLTFAERACTQRDTKGLRYLAFLLQTPQREWHVLDLLALTDADPEGIKVAASLEVFTGQLTVRRKRSAELPTLDAPARAAYRRRLEDLQAELREADAWNDTGRATQAREELELIAAELARAYGSVHHARARDADAEKARKAVTNRIRAALANIQKAHPPLWHHLFTSIKTGTFCSYHPTHPTQWSF